MSDVDPGKVADEHVAVYLRFKRIFGDGSGRATKPRAKSTREGASVAFGAGRDPRGLGEVMDGLAAHMGWTSPLARSELVAEWGEIVGADTAAHSEPTSIEGSVLTVRCDSTAWATQLRLMRSAITSHIIERYPDAGIDSVRFEGPNAPSWKRGPRSIPGRGPRDTYG
jgi:predicted nucleic acid-binding Zn ribbon protein